MSFFSNPFVVSFKNVKFSFYIFKHNFNSILNLKSFRHKNLSFWSPSVANTLENHTSN